MSLADLRHRAALERTALLCIQAGARARTKAKSRFRCAIYTRKSTEEGLKQAFNTLDAQRASCEAYVLSQAGDQRGRG